MFLLFSYNWVNSTVEYDLIVITKSLKLSECSFVNPCFKPFSQISFIILSVLKLEDSGSFGLTVSNSYLMLNFSQPK